jgi:membrane protease YdiL (CAAX protease family)
MIMNLLGKQMRRAKTPIDIGDSRVIEVSTTDKEGRSKNRIALFLILLVATTLAANFAAPRLGTGPAVAFLFMGTPAIAAILASIFTRRSFREFGWKPWPIKWLGLGWLLPILIGLPAYGVVWLTGLGDIPNPLFLERGRITIGMPGGPNWLFIIAAFGFITIVNLLPNIVLSLGEELGWRGFLVPELTKKFGFKQAAIFSGVIWGAWHLPGILSGSYGAGSTPLAYRIACFSALVIGDGVIMAWLRMKSGSIWPAVIMHATHNGVIQAFFDAITAPTSLTPWFIGEFGIALVPFTALAAWYFWKRSGEIAPYASVKTRSLFERAADPLHA